MNKEFFEKGVKEIISLESLKSKLELGKKLRIKYGVDPTRPDIHLGHTVQLWKLRKLQDEGHTVIFLIGDYTTKIGDPSGRNSTRPILTDNEIEANAKTYFGQVGKILDIKKTEIRYNSEWFSKMDFNDLLQLAGKFTVAQILERDDFQKRITTHNDIGLHETLYPLMQAYDSVMLKADVEFGGSDQKFNLLAGRDLQKKMGQAPQDVYITDLLVGLDGKIKMSKSAENYIAITDNANQMFGKIMSIPDNLIVNYFELVTNKTEEEVSIIRKSLENGENPKNIKMELGYEIVQLYHGKVAAESAKQEFVNIFSKKELPSDIPLVEVKGDRTELTIMLVEIGATTSNNEAKRLIEQGGVKIDDVKITDPRAEITVKSGSVIQVGKRKFYKIK